MLIQYIYNNLDFRSPFFVTYVANSMLVCYLPLWQLWIFLGIVDDNNIEPTNVDRKSTDIAIDNESPASMMEENDDMDDGLVIEPTVSTRKSYTHWDVIKIAVFVAPIWFGANCLYNYSLFLTSVSSSTVIRY